ncbi:HprK-related kinase A [Paraglaciecola aestuariivivens]
MLLNLGLYIVNINTDQPIIPSINAIYGDAKVPDAPVDFEVRLHAPSLLRRYVRPQVSFYCDQHTPFKPLPASQAFALLEWGMNWCIATHDHTRLLIHAAVIVKDNQAIIFPASPGSGKSTLSAFMALSGWSLYSDEMAVIDLDNGTVAPLFRPVCLKNDSIGLVKKWFPKSIFTETCRDTQKGDVAHLKGTTWNDFVNYSAVDIAAVVFPKFQKDTQLKIYSINQLQAFEGLSEHSFNCGVLANLGFNCIDKIIKNTALFEIEYSDLSEVKAFLEDEIIS